MSQRRAAAPALIRRRVLPAPAEGRDARLALPDGDLDGTDPLAQMAQAEAADASLMRLVLCAAGATLVLAIASSLL